MRESDKRFVDQFREMERRMGRMFRNMAVPRMGDPLTRGTWVPAADVYETEDAVYVYVDTAGIDPKELVVTAERNSVTVAGSRKVPDRAKIRCVHQLEIEHGSFSRSISFSVPIDVSATTSKCNNGLLEIILPKEIKAGRVAVKVST